MCLLFFLDPAQHNTSPTAWHPSHAYKFASPVREQWVFSNCSVAPAISRRVSHLHPIWILQTLQRLGFKQQMCLLAICYAVCQDVRGKWLQEVIGYRLWDFCSVVWMYSHIDRWPPERAAMSFYDSRPRVSKKKRKDKNAGRKTLIQREGGAAPSGGHRLQHYQRDYDNYCHIVKELASFRNIKWAQKWTDAPTHKQTRTHRIIVLISKMLYLATLRTRSGSFGLIRKSLN